MTDEANKNKEAKKPKDGDQAQPPQKGGLITYIIYGVIGLVAVFGVAFGALMLMGDDPVSDSAVEEQVDDQAKSAEKHGEDTEHSEMSEVDSILALLEQDESVIEEIMANLEMLDYVPGEKDLIGEEIGMSVEDSIEAVNWLEKEKTRLAEHEKELDVREKRLNILDSKVTQKILRIEQAESTRIAKLAKLYDGMEARSVARLIANLDDETVVSLLPRMKLKNASSVLSLMPPVRAARLSKQMITIAEN